MKSTRIGMVVVATSIAGNAVAAGPEFHVLGSMNGGPAIPWALSADGSVAVGSVGDPTMPPNAFRWTRSDGLQNLGLPAGATGAAATSTSADGSVVAGNLNFSAQLDRGFRWTVSGGFQNLGVMAGMTYSAISGVSADGSIAVGTSGNTSTYFPARWSVETGMQNLGKLPPFSLTSANAVSGDGKVAVGSATSGGPTHAVRWTDGGSPQDLGMFDGNYANPYAVSYDGSVIVGAGVNNPFRWVLSQGMLPIGLLPGATLGIAHGVSDDGNTIVGLGKPTPGWVWTPVDGLRSVMDVLDAYGILPLHWTDLQVLAISGDGLSFAGYGTDENGANHGWVARLGTPIRVTLDLSQFSGMTGAANAIVPLGSRLSNQLLYTKGILFSSGAPYAAIVNVGSTVAPIGSTALMSVASNNRLSLDGSLPVRGEFFSPNNGISPAVTDSISVQADKTAGPGTATLKAYGLDGSLLATQNSADFGGETLSISIPGIHRWEFTGDGTIYIGNIQFNQVLPRCAGDLNADAVVDDADFVDFATFYNLLLCEDPAMPTGCPADFNRDGVVDDSDFVQFVVSYDILACP